ncbi:putative transcriptional regulator [Orenia metallireducens]|uniref:Putative transcriptional regulator n=1 Tax=Orenia metallireducens TaxID=1413210 RepID=A0A285IGD6_9FIRM|nr:helix-turn-helix transcriptional regulator [Orenia metallireducens]PRX18099.1 putative transcriptional regulator [Orenia metallireducens]SNY47029.1 putative transcriptional regulator [Orenia metallireducens]
MRKKLKEKRLEKGLTQKRIAQKIGISRGHYTNIELGHKEPSFKVARAIKKELDEKNDDIFLISNVPKGNKTNHKAS